MKKASQWTILFCVLILISHDALANGRRLPGIHVGLKGGASFATLSGDPLLTYDARIGLCSGVFVNIPVTPALSVQPEILYTQKGAKVSGYCGGVPTTWTLKLDYVEVPILISASLSNSGSISPRVFLGPEMTFKASFREESKNRNGALTVDVEGLRTNEICFVFGLGIDVPLGPGSLMLEARLTPGIMSIQKDDLGGHEKNVSYSLLLGYSPGRR